MHISIRKYNEQSGKWDRKLLKIAEKSWWNYPYTYIYLIIYVTLLRIDTGDQKAL